MIKTIEFLEAKKLPIEKEFEIYQKIFQYINENPDVVRLEERYVTKVVDRLIEMYLFDKKVPQNLRDVISKTLEDFLNKNKDNGYKYV